MSRNTSTYTRTPPAAAPDPLPNRLIRLLSEARWLLLAVIGAYLTLVMFTYSTADSGWSHAGMSTKPLNWGGSAGAWLSDLMFYIFGFSAWWWCVAMLASVWVSYRRLAKRFFLEQEQELPHRYEVLIRIGGFVLLVLGSCGLEFVRMYSLKVKLPRDPGGVLGELVGGSAQAGFGFDGGTLLLLMLFGLGFSLCFHVSWLAVAERLGGAIESFVQLLNTLYVEWQDRKVGHEAPLSVKKWLSKNARA